MFDFKIINWDLFFFLPSFSHALLQIKKSNLLHNFKLCTVIRQFNQSPTTFYMEINKICFWEIDWRKSKPTKLICGDDGTVTVQTQPSNTTKKRRFTFNLHSEGKKRFPTELRPKSSTFASDWEIYGMKTSYLIQKEVCKGFFTVLGSNLAVQTLTTIIL